MSKGASPKDMPHPGQPGIFSRWTTRAVGIKPDNGVSEGGGLNGRLFPSKRVRGYQTQNTGPRFSLFRGGLCFGGNSTAQPKRLNKRCATPEENHFHVDALISDDFPLRGPRSHR